MVGMQYAILSAYFEQQPNLTTSSSKLEVQMLRWLKALEALKQVQMVIKWNLTKPSTSSPSSPVLNEKLLTTCCLNLTTKAG